MASPLNRRVALTAGVLLVASTLIASTETTWSAQYQPQTYMSATTMWAYSHTVNAAGMAAGGALANGFTGTTMVDQRAYAPSTPIIGTTIAPYLGWQLNPVIVAYPRYSSIATPSSTP